MFSRAIHSTLGQYRLWDLDEDRSPFPVNNIFTDGQIDCEYAAPLDFQSRDSLVILVCVLDHKL